MALTPEVRVSNTGTFSLTQLTADDLRTTQTGVMTLGSFPAERVDVSNTGVQTLVDYQKEIRVSNSQVLALAQGRISDPNVRAWTFTLDGHDFYVLNVGDQETLVFDASVGEWVTWGNDERSVFFAKTGINWLGGDKLADTYGSNVLIGHDTAGTVMILDPRKSVDESPIPDDVNNPPTFNFRRQVTVQTVVPSGYYSVPCYDVQLHGSIGDNDEEANNLTVTLEYSDDRGKSYTSAGSLTVPSEDYDFRVNWRSLGSYETPGRLFRFTDYGAMKRLDGVNVEDGLE